MGCSEMGIANLIPSQPMHNCDGHAAVAGRQGREAQATTKLLQEAAGEEEHRGCGTDPEVEQISRWGRLGLGGVGQPH